jgi:hypothetical protein
VKISEVLGFVDGVITVKVSGHGEENGDGHLSFNEDSLFVEEDGSRWAKIKASELIAIRDFLDRVLTKVEPPKSEYIGPARDGIEAQHGLNDTYPGDPYP